jgi:hypothetical protein
MKAIKLITTLSLLLASRPLSSLTRHQEQPSAGLTQVSRELASALGTELRVHRFAEVSLASRASPITKRERGDARQGDEKDRKKRVCPYTHRSLIRMIAKPRRSNHEQDERYRNDPLPIATFFEGFNILLGLKVIVKRAR